MKTLWLDTIDSTNSEALRRLAELPSMTVLAAREQTAGRGQRGNTWFTEPGKNLTFSIVLKFGEGELHASQVHWLNYLISVVVADFLQSHGIWCKVKWPNDVYVGKNKICGILIENTLETGMVRDSIVGIGLNLNECNWPTELPNPVSLGELTGRTYVPETELEALHKEIRRRFGQLASSDGRCSLQEEFGKLMFRLPEAP